MSPGDRRASEPGRGARRGLSRERLAPVADAVAIARRAKRLMARESVARPWCTMSSRCRSPCWAMRRRSSPRPRGCRASSILVTANALRGKARRPRGRLMEVLVYLVPMALALGLLGPRRVPVVAQIRPVRRPRRRRLARPSWTTTNGRRRTSLPPAEGARSLSGRPSCCHTSTRRAGRARRSAASSWYGLGRDAQPFGAARATVG